MPLPLYGFMQGDTIGLLILAEEQDSVQVLARRLQDAANLRVSSNGEMEVVYQGTVLDPALTLAEIGFSPLQRFDVRRNDGFSERRDA